MTTVLVIGAGPSGAAVSLFLARRGFRVVAVDRNPVTRDGDRFDRKRDRHTTQGHSFLARGTRVLDEEIPDVVGKLLDAGARRVPLRHEPQYWNLLSRRRLFDGILQDAVRREPDVEFLENAVAEDLLFDADEPDRPPRVTGVRIDGAARTADWVIDAAGRRSPAAKWLAARGIALEEENHPTRFIYITRHYRLKRGAEFPTVRVPIVEALDYATALAFPEDNGYFQLSLQVDCRDPARRALRNPSVFDRVLASVPSMKSWLDVAGAVGDPQPFGSVGNTFRRACRRGPLVRGLLLVGDAAVHTNPTAGRGVSLALAHAQALTRLLSDMETAEDERVVESWDRITHVILRPWFESQLVIDEERRRQIDSALKGIRWRPADQTSNRLARGLSLLKDSRTVGAAGDRLLNLLSTPDEVFSDREVLQSVLRATRQPSTADPALPSHEEFTRLTMTDTHA